MLKLKEINCYWSIALCDNCNHSILLCDLHKVSLKSQTGILKVFYTFTEGYISQEHMALMCIMFENIG